MTIHKINGDKYVCEGLWEDNGMYGKGKIEYSDQRKYEGLLYDSKMHGFGIMTWFDG